MLSTRKRLKEIREARELLRIESRFKKAPDFVRNILFGAVIVIYSGFLFFYLTSTVDNSAGERIAISFVVLSCIMGVFFPINKILTTRGNPLLITERGIALAPSMAEFWEDIQEYGWQSFQGLNKIYCSRKYGEGVTLLIINKGLSQRNILPYPEHSALANWAVFFTPEQSRVVEHIFNQHGIKKNKDWAYVEATNNDGKKINSNYVLVFQIFCVVIPTIAIILLNILGILAFKHFYALLAFLIIMDTAVIILLIWQSRKRKG